MPENPSGAGIGRRRFLLGGAAVATGAAVALTAERTGVLPGSRQAELNAAGLNGARTIEFHGEHQAGIDTPVAAHASFVALRLRPGQDRESLGRLMRLLTDDARRLTSGRSPLADSEPELAAVPAGLTVTFGFGPGFVSAAGATAPMWLAPLPAYPTIDDLRPEWTGGDLLIVASADDPVTVAHAVRMLLKDSRHFASVAWRQDGFRRAYGSEVSGTTMRNLMGQVDGTGNPEPGTADFDAAVWSTDGWLAGGTSMVLRRIRMELDTWDEIDGPGRDNTVGRRISNGAPVTGERESDDPDYEATTAAGFSVISPVAHISRASDAGRVSRTIFRRSYNYDVPPTGEAVSETGLIFASLQADVGEQYIPVQDRLAQADLLNEWTTPIGSAVFAIPPGCGPDGFIGEGILT